MNGDFLDALRPLFDCLTDGVCVADAEGQVLYANAAAGRLLGPAAESVAKEAICGPLCGGLEGHCAKDAAECALKVPRGPQDAITFKGRFPPTGKDLRVRCMRVRLPSGERHFLVIEDVSEQAAAGRKRVEWRQMLAHDLRSPLSIAFGTLRAVEDMGVGHALAPDDLALIQGGVRNCRRLETLIGSYLDTTRLENGDMPVHSGSIDAAMLVRGVVEEMTPAAASGGLALTVAAPESLAARADPELLRRALANIIDNALKFTPRGGRVEVAGSARGADILLRVADNGPGIPVENLPRVFDRYFQGEEGGRRRGLGLGLTFCRAALRAMGGDVEVESNVGQGTVFTVRLPAAVPGASP